MNFENVNSFDDWRLAARRLLERRVSPGDIQWTDETAQPSLFETGRSTKAAQGTSTFSVPKVFVEIAKNVCCHRDSRRWALLYRTLWRLLHDERHLLAITTDDDVYALTQMQKAVTRDVHKMKAFVRFRKVVTASSEDSYIAWHRPDHNIVKIAATFFARRFKGMNWSILTPDESVFWDQHSLQYGPGVPASEAPDGDELEELWKTYYASIFNPARVKVAMMKREMPVRHWPTLPEASLIQELLERAPERVESMTQKYEGFAETAMNYMPEHLDLESLREASAGCKACNLFQCASRTVFGEGASAARIVLVGEQPGDREDIEGRPFVGPAGRLLNDALKLAGIERSETYVTNVVKHFKFVENPNSRGKQRLHKKPNSREIFACRPWLEAELAIIRPEVVVCLGATPAQALFGRDFRITQYRGKVLATDWCPRTLATWHPAAILRMPDQLRRQQMLDQFINDLKSVT
ncbi:MAG: UdgX family uracil-DNA binding protein [Aureliella sp.]